MSEIAFLPKPRMACARSTPAFSLIAAVESPISLALGSGEQLGSGEAVGSSEAARSVEVAGSGEVRSSEEAWGSGEARGSSGSGEEEESTVTERRLKGVGGLVHRAEPGLRGGGA